MGLAVLAQENLVEDGFVADTLDPAGVMVAGTGILADELAPSGFAFELTGHGHSSGGDFATGRFTRGDQYLELHFWRSLGLVRYGWGGSVLSHADYLAGLNVSGAYPGYGAEALDGFRHLAQDLAGPLSGFRAGNRSGFERAIRVARRPLCRSLP